MEQQRSRTDRWLRPMGAAGIFLFFASLIVLSFYGRDSTTWGEQERHSVRGRLIGSASFLENWFYDLRSTRFYQHDHPSPHLVILEINDEALNKIGRWPWTRTRHAEVIEHLRTYGAKTVIFDVGFPEPESDAADGALVAAIHRFSEDPHHSVIISYGIADDPEHALQPLPDGLLASMVGGGGAPSPAKGSMAHAWWPDKFNFVAPKILAGDASLGFFSAVPDLDGVFRSIQLLQEMDSNYIPSLGLKAFIDFYSDGKDNQVFAEPIQGLAHRLRITGKEGQRYVNLNAQGELKMRFFGGEPDFVRVGIDEVLGDKSPGTNADFKRIFGGKAVLIGSSAIGANDVRHTPVDSLMPGMYMHANLFHALDQNLLFRDEESSFWISFALCLAGMGMVVLLSRLKNPCRAGTGAMLGLLFAADYYYFAPQGFFIRLFFVLNGALWLQLWFTLLNVFKEAREKKKIRDAFSRYVAPEIVKEMLANPDKLKVGGEKREITMLFSDIRGFTTISERLSAQELATLLNIYMGRMTDILFDTGGTLDKYIGDAMVGFWGAPLDIPDHAYQAVRGAKLMLDALPEINQIFESRKFPRINIGIGLNTGEVSVGNMGSDKIFQYTALGDNMNLASRLEGQTKYYGVNLMISEFTLAKMGAKAKEFRLRPLDLLQVVGRSKAVKIYEVIANNSPWAKEDALLAQFTAAYEQKYLSRRFKEALADFDQVLALIPDDKTTKKLKENTEYYLQNPPPESWDGVTIASGK